MIYTYPDTQLQATWWRAVFVWLDKIYIAIHLF